MQRQSGKAWLVAFLIYNAFASSNGKILAEAQPIQNKIRILDIMEMVYCQNLTDKSKKNSLYKPVL